MKRTFAAPLRVGIVGLGKMGLLHCKTWQRIDGVQLVALVDTDPSKAAWAGTQGCAFFTQSQTLVGLVDLAIIATPAVTTRQAPGPCSRPVFTAWWKNLWRWTLPTAGSWCPAPTSIR